MCLIHSFWFAALSDAVTIANSPAPPSSRAASSASVPPMPCGVAWFTRKSRASASESASQVSTLMPRDRALRSTVEIAAWFSTLTAMTSTFRVIHASTTSFCLAGSSSVGPSQMRSTFRSEAACSAPLRQLTKYGSPLALGIMPITVREADGGWRAISAAVSSGAMRSERTSHQFEVATTAAAQQNHAAQDGQL